MSMKQTIGIIGFGNMGQAIADRIKSKYAVFVFDKEANKTSGQYGIVVAKSALGVIGHSGAIILAVKPQDFDNVLNEIKGHTSKKLIISIAAGITTAYIEKRLTNARVIRVMPNIAAKIGQAETCVSRGSFAVGRDLDFTKELFDLVGKTWIVKEEIMDAATAICGSGPAYIYYDMEINKYDAKNLPSSVESSYIERLAKAAERVGFDVQTAFDLSQATTMASVRLSVLTEIPPAELRKMVSSKGGTTEAALEVIMNGGSWEDAAVAARKRAEELSKKE